MIIREEVDVARVETRCMVTRLNLERKKEGDA
jgi:hypothetical protein